MCRATCQQHGLATLGALFSESLEISSLEDLRRWSTVMQAFIEAAERWDDPILDRLVQLKENTYRHWVKPVWSEESGRVT